MSEERFLLEWANLRDGCITRFLTIFNKRLLPEEKEAVVFSNSRVYEYRAKADELRKFWSMEDGDEKFYLGYRLVEWAVAHTRHLLLLKATGETDRPNFYFMEPFPALRSEPRRPFPLEAAFIYLLKKSRFTAVCEHPDCPSPYYFRKKPRQRYCGDDCRRCANKESKLSYWDRKGKQTRKRKRIPQRRK